MKFLPKYRFYIFLSILIAVLYGFTINYGFITFDDKALIVLNQNIKGLTLNNLKEIFKVRLSGTYQPIRELSYAINYTISGLNTWSYRIVNILLYFFCIIIVYKVLSILFPDDKIIPYFSTLIFTVHPIHVECITWLSARKEVLMLVFFLLCFLYFLKYKRLEKYHNWKYILLMFLFFMLAGLSKPTAVMIPFAFLVYEIVYERFNFPKDFKKYIPFFIVLLILFIYFTAFSGVSISMKNIYPGIPLSTMLYSISHYFKTLVFPVNLAGRYRDFYNLSYTNPDVIIGILVLILSLLLVIKYWKKQKNIVFFIFWYYINLLPSIGLIRIAIQRADRYIFVSSLSFCVLFPIFVMKTADIVFKNEKYKKYLNYGIITLVLLFFSLSTIKQNEMWENNIVFYEISFRNSPCYGVGRALVDRYIYKKRFHDALDILKEMDRIHGLKYETKNLMGEIYMLLEEYDKSINEFKLSYFLAENEKDSLGALRKIIIVYEKDEQYEKSAEFSKLLYLKTGERNYFHDYAIFKYKAGEFNEAVKTLIKILDKEPENEFVLKNLGLILYEAGYIEEAEKYLIKYISLNPPLEEKSSILELLNKVGND
ncbi:glycosyltransferase family 39 protein [bacterium]|nr:glycosyltransferase family 39 protein [bacterium]